MNTVAVLFADLNWTLARNLGILVLVVLFARGGLMGAIRRITGHG